jgi:uncharacterized damage-inducible protein DinB
MTALEQLRRLCEHTAWADAELLAVFEANPAAPAAALREYAHVLGAAEVWLARLEGRPATAAIWPTLTLPELEELARRTSAGYVRYLATLTDSDIARGVAYTNSAGLHFVTPIGDILLHVALHGQYHRGKVNLLLSDAALAPAPVDFIAFVRGVPAATTPSAPR